ncbi:MAG: hypothetical protein LBS11_01395 [Oscillospiraceae bacterium]|jgi:hypothetical protein|nr:hypothetical protein [Oscillospiraceae bacterium]
MADSTPPVCAIVRDYVEQGKSFVINRARHFGKTTTLFLLKRMPEHGFDVARRLKKAAGQISVSNRAFEQYAYNHFVSMRRTNYQFQTGVLELSAYIRDGLLDTTRVVERFSDMIKSEYRLKRAFQRGTGKIVISNLSEANN